MFAEVGEGFVDFAGEALFDGAIGLDKPAAEIGDLGAAALMSAGRRDHHGVGEHAVHRVDEKPRAAVRHVEPPPGRESDAYIATEAEVLRSQTLRAAMKERTRLDLAADALVVTPRSGSRVIEVGVRDPDKQRAAQLCNELMRTYLEYRMERALVPMLEEEKALAEQLEKHPEDDKLRERMKELELSRRVPKIDVRLLDPCTSTASRR